MATRFIKDKVESPSNDDVDDDGENDREEQYKAIWFRWNMCDKLDVWQVMGYLDFFFLVWIWDEEKASEIWWSWNW